MTVPRDHSEMDDTLWRALEAVGGGVSTGTIADIALLIRVGERLVAYETLATQAYEYCVELDAALVSDLRAIGSSLQADSKYGEWLGACAVEA